MLKRIWGVITLAKKKRNKHKNTVNVDKNKEKENKDPAGQQDKPEEKQKKSGWAMLKDIVVIFVLALALSMAFKGLVIDNRLIPTSSMVPTVPVNGRILVNRLVYELGGEPEFQDIVVFEPTELTKIEIGRGDDMLKRVIGLAGDEIMVHEGVLYRNGEALEEPYVQVTMDYEFGPVTVPEDCVLLLGDNRNASFDAHMWSDPFVPVKNVKGKAFLLYWPIEEFKLLK